MMRSYIWSLNCFPSIISDNFALLQNAYFNIFMSINIFILYIVIIFAPSQPFPTYLLYALSLKTNNANNKKTKKHKIPRKQIPKHTRKISLGQVYKNTIEYALCWPPAPGHGIYSYFEVLQLEVTFLSL